MFDKNKKYIYLEYRYKDRLDLAVFEDDRSDASVRISVFISDWDKKPQIEDYPNVHSNIHEYLEVNEAKSTRYRKWWEVDRATFMRSIINHIKNKEREPS